jgi:hypothetical protein
MFVNRCYQGNSYHGHKHYISCSDRTREWDKHHTKIYIPENVDETLLSKCINGQPLSDDDTIDTPPCSGFIPSHIGGKQKHCRKYRFLSQKSLGANFIPGSAHIVNGLAVTQSKILTRKCGASRTIFVLKDSNGDNLNIAVIVPKTTPHNHPMPPPAKVSASVARIYTDAIKLVAEGTSATTAQKVDNGNCISLLAFVSHNSMIPSNIQLHRRGKSSAA